MHQNAFGGRALPGPAGGAYSARPDPLAGLREGDRGVGVGKGKGKEREGRRKGGSALTPMMLISGSLRVLTFNF